MQLDGVNNQIQFPNSATELLFTGDTNLFRASANTLKTSGNVVVGGLNANQAVATDSNQQLVSNVTSATELGYVSGVTSPIQSQLNNKVNNLISNNESNSNNTNTIPVGLIFNQLPQYNNKLRELQNKLNLLHKKLTTLRNTSEEISEAVIQETKLKTLNKT